MKFWKTIFLVISVLCIFSGVAMSQDTGDETNEDPATTEAAPVPDNAEMALGFDSGATPTLPANFRGGDPDTGLVHALEDVYYEKQEHSLIYNANAAELAEGAKFESDPNITWDTKVKDDDGNWTTQTSQNTNVARDGGKFFEPGEYQIGNSGARQVAAGSGGAEDTSGSEGGAASDTSLVDESGETGEGGTKTVTAQQSMGVLVHDSTSPDVWVAFQEGAGSVDMAETEKELQTEIMTKIIEKAGRPFSSNPEDFEEASYLFVDEGTKDERDADPLKKTARLSIAGPLFNERGAPKFESGLVPSKPDEKDMTQQVHVSGGPDKNLKGVFVRRNVPFIFAAMGVDNGNKRGNIAEVACRIETADGKEVEKEENAFLFRVPNYPREEYKDQPEYYFVALGSDKEGNITTIRLPLYVMNTKVSYEGGSNE